MNSNLIAVDFDGVIVVKTQLEIEKIIAEIEERKS